MTWQAFGAAIVQDYLLANFLMGPLRSHPRELQMTEVRRRCLLARAAPPGLMAHLAVQGHLNEYCWRQTGPEVAEVERLKAALLAGSRDPWAIMAYASYAPLVELPIADELAAGGFGEHADAVIASQIVNVREERRLAAATPALTAIQGQTSAVVREMYEANPYPRWERAGDAVGEVPASIGDAPDVLIAGCGTGRHAIQAAKRYARGKVLAVDLSLASLGFAQRKAREVGAGNLHIAQADLLQLPATGRTFDVVEAVGSLPCMESPEEGLAALTSMLRPGGAMFLGLYSSTARQVLAPAMELGKSFAHTPDGIRAFRTRILDAAQSDPVRAPVEWGDFYSTSGCRDLLLHVVEHQHSVPQIADMLARHGLRFGRFELPRAAAQLADPGDLMAWAEVEARHPHLFRGMYQFWVHKPA